MGFKDDSARLVELGSIQVFVEGYFQVQEELAKALLAVRWVDRAREPIKAVSRKVKTCAQD